MNSSSIEIIHLPQSGYVAYYSAAWRTGREAVKDEKGEPIRHPTAKDAKLAAYEALFAAENKAYALRYDASQLKETRKVWETARPRSGAGKRMLANAHFKPVEVVD